MVFRNNFTEILFEASKYTDTSTSLKMEEEIVELVDFCFC